MLQPTKAEPLSEFEFRQLEKIHAEARSCPWYSSLSVKALVDIVPKLIAEIKWLRAKTTAMYEECKATEDLLRTKAGVQK